MSSVYKLQGPGTTKLTFKNFLKHPIHEDIETKPTIWFSFGAFDLCYMRA